MREVDFLFGLLALLPFQQLILVEFGPFALATGSVPSVLNTRFLLGITSKVRVEAILSICVTRLLLIEVLIVVCEESLHEFSLFLLVLFFDAKELGP